MVDKTEMVMKQNTVMKEKITKKEISFELQLIPVKNAKREKKGFQAKKKYWSKYPSYR